MKFYIVRISLLVLSVLLSACMGTGGQIKKNQCASVNNDDGTITFKESQIVMKKCKHGLHFSQLYQECKLVGFFGLSSNWFDVMAAAKSESSIDKMKADWRIPTKEDMTVIGSCLKSRETYWTSTLASNEGKVIVYLDGVFKDGIPDSASGQDGLLISGGSPTSQQAFAAVFAEKVVPQLERQKLAYKKKNGEDATALNASIKRTEAIRKSEAIARTTSPKGTTINCTTDSVVPVNTSLNNVSFSCPSLGNVNANELRKSKWKITSTERIKSQASSYRLDDFGMKNWNGLGVIISIIIEKN
jgi:hypothetical protein